MATNTAPAAPKFDKTLYGGIFNSGLVNSATSYLGKKVNNAYGNYNTYSQNGDSVYNLMSAALADKNLATTVFGKNASLLGTNNMFASGTMPYLNDWVYDNNLNATGYDGSASSIFGNLGSYFTDPTKRTALSSQGNKLGNMFSVGTATTTPSTYDTIGDTGLASSFATIPDRSKNLSDYMTKDAIAAANAYIANGGVIDKKYSMFDPVVGAAMTYAARDKGKAFKADKWLTADQAESLRNFLNTGVDTKGYLTDYSGTPVNNLLSSLGIKANANNSDENAFLQYITGGYNSGNSLKTQAQIDAQTLRDKQLGDWRDYATGQGWGKFANNKFNITSGQEEAMGKWLADNKVSGNTLRDVMGWGQSFYDGVLGNNASGLGRYVDLGTDGNLARDSAWGAEQDSTAAANTAKDNAIIGTVYDAGGGTYKVGGQDSGFTFDPNADANTTLTALFDKGYNTTDIARAMGATPEQAMSYISSAGWKVDSAGKLVKPTAASTAATIDTATSPGTTPEQTQLLSSLYSAGGLGYDASGKVTVTDPAAVFKYADANNVNISALASALGTTADALYSAMSGAGYRIDGSGNIDPVLAADSASSTSSSTTGNSSMDAILQQIADIRGQIQRGYGAGYQPYSGGYIRNGGSRWGGNYYGASAPQASYSPRRAGWGASIVV